MELYEKLESKEDVQVEVKDIKFKIRCITGMIGE
jgi:hypothetical protein